MTEQWLKCVAATYSKSSDTLNIGVKSNHKGLTFKALVAVTDGIVFRGAKAYTCSKAPSSLGYDFVLSIKMSAVSVEPSAETAAHTLIESLNKRIVKKMGECDRGKWILQEDFEKAFAKQEKAKPDGTGYTADLAYNGLWVGLVRLNGEIDEHDFLVVSVLGRSVLEAALGTLHRSYRAVKAMPTVTEVAIPSKLSLESTNFRSPYAAAYVIRRDNAWIGADGMIRRLNDLITREASNFGDAYTRRLQDRGGSNGPVWYRSVEAAKFFMELNVEPVAPKSEQPKHEAKLVSAGDWAALLVDPAFSETRFTVVTPLPGQVLEEALGAMHRSSFAVLTTAIEATPKILKQVDKGFLPPEVQAAVDGHTFSKDGNLAPSIFVLERKDTHTWLLKAAEVVKKLNSFIDRHLGGDDGLVKFITEYGFRPDRGDYKWYRHEKTAGWFKDLYRGASPEDRQEKPKAAGKPRKWIEFADARYADAREIYVITSLSTQSLVKAAVHAYMKATMLAATPPQVISCPAVLDPPCCIRLKFGEEWRENRLKGFIEGLNAFVEKALGPDPASPTVKTGGKTAALWKLAEDMRGQKKDQSDFTVIGGKILDKGDSSPYHQPCCSGYGFDLRFSKQLDDDFREKALDVIRLACKECRPAWLKKGDSLTFYEIRPEKNLLDIEILPYRSEWPSEAAERQVRDACLRKIMETFGATMDVIEPSSGPKKPEAKEPTAKTWRVGEWLEYCSYGKLDGLPGQEKFEINFATIPLRELDLTTVKMVVGAFHIDRLGNNGGPGVSVEELNDVEFNGKKFGTAYRLTVPYDVFQALYCTANPVSGLDKFIAETFRSKAEPAEAKKPETKKPEAKRTVWGAGFGSLFEDAS